MTRAALDDLHRRAELLEARLDEVHQTIAALSSDPAPEAEPPDKPAWRVPGGAIERRILDALADGPELAGSLRIRVGAPRGNKRYQTVLRGLVRAGKLVATGRTTDRAYALAAAEGEA